MLSVLFGGLAMAFPHGRGVASAGVNYDYGALRFSGSITVPGGLAAAVVAGSEYPLVAFPESVGFSGKTTVLEVSGSELWLSDVVFSLAGFEGPYEDVVEAVNGSYEFSIEITAAGTPYTFTVMTNCYFDYADDSEVNSGHLIVFSYPSEFDGNGYSMSFAFYQEIYDELQPGVVVLCSLNAFPGSAGYFRVDSKGANRMVLFDIICFFVPSSYSEADILAFYGPIANKTQHGADLIAFEMFFDSVTYVSLIVTGSVSYSAVSGSAAFPPDPTPPAHMSFAGWYYNEDFTVPYEGFPVIEDFPLYAKFVLTVYTVAFDAGAPGLTAASVSVTALDQGGDFASPGVYTGHTFQGWFYDKSHTEAYDPEAPVTGNMTLYAGWEQIFLTVTFYVGGEVYAVLQVPYGSALASAAQALAAQNGVNMALYTDPYLYYPYSDGAAVMSDLSVYAEVSGIPAEPIGFFQRVGDWFGANWIYFAVGGGAFALALILAGLRKLVRG
jgi:uncharacterized repeat protein (TIGR02543 family)